MADLVIDCQILQTEAYDRGMGKYTLSLLKEVIKKNSKSHQYANVHLILNKNLNITKKRKEILKQYMPSGQLTILDLPTDISEDHKEKRHKAKETITKFIKTKQRHSPDIDYLITAPFFVGFTSVFPDTERTKKLVIVYDLTPQKIWGIQKIFPDSLYFSHYSILLEADCLLTISHAVKDDLKSILGLSDKKIKEIDGAPFMVKERKGSQGFSLKQPYVLMPTAPIIHKNNEKAVMAFRDFNRLHNEKYSLYITSKFDEGTKKILRRIYDKVEFTGNISDEDLSYAYSLADAVLFPSLAEGLGMPVLEGVMHDTPVACSRIPVLEEISKDAFYFFNPNRVDSISAAIESAVQKENWRQKHEAYDAVKKKYTWQNSAKKLLDAARDTELAVSKKKENLRLDIPHPGNENAAAFFGEQAYAALASVYNVGLVFSGRASNSRASFLMHIPSKETGEALEIKIASRSNITDYIKRRSRIIITGHSARGGKRAEATLLAHVVFIDPAVGLKGWKFLSVDGKEKQPIKVLHEIIKGIKND